MPYRNLLTLLVLAVFCFACNWCSERLKYGGKIGRNIQLIEDNYVNEVNPEELYIAAMQGIVSKLDRFSSFIPPKNYQQFQSVFEQEIGGVGILIEGPPQVEQLTVVSPIPKSPAFLAGVRPGDVITYVGDKSTAGIKATDATKLMRGPTGKEVQLTVQRRGTAEPIVMNIKRAVIPVDSVFGDRINSDCSQDFLVKEDPRIAYLRISLFGERTAGEFSDALNSISNQASAIVLDLRDNPGGVLEASVQMCDMLIDHGTIVSTRGRHVNSELTLKATAGTIIDKTIPMVVLVDQDSASASEIMAGCLQDAGRAVIGGQRSYGKGTVQKIFPLERDQTVLKFTTARFYRPSGKNIHRTEKMTPADIWGISPAPDLEVELTDAQRLQLQLRWRRNGDPRVQGDPTQPPIPEFAGDPQLESAVRHLQQQLDSPNVQ